MDELELLLYGVIGDEDCSAKFVRAQIAATEGPITVRINSGGGYVVEGLAIFNALDQARQAGRKVTVHIDGLAASMASVIAMVGEEIHIADNAMMMIHNPWDIAMGDAEALRKKADQLDKIRDQLVGIYVNRTGQSESIVTAMMTAETWMDAEEALENKFATSITESSSAQAAIKPVDVTKFGFNHVPTGNPLIFSNPAAPVPSTAQASLVVPKEKNVDPELIKKIMAFVRAQNVSDALADQALAGTITYDEMVAQHNAAVAAAAAEAAAGNGGALNSAAITRVLNYTRTHNVAQEISDRCLTGDITFDQMIDQHTQALADADAATGGSGVRAGRELGASPIEEARMRAQMLTVASLEGLGLSVPERMQPNERTRAYGEQTVRSLAQFVCRANNIQIRADSSDREVIRAAMQVQGPQASSGGVISTGDLGSILGQPIHATFDRGYQDQLAETTYGVYTTEMLVPDFKGVSMVNLGLPEGIRKVSEGGKLPLAKLGDGARFVQLGTDGLKISFTRESIINDEFGALIGAVNTLGMVFRQFEDDQAMDALIDGILVEKNDDGQWVQNEVFGEEYSNVVEVSALDEDGIAAAREAMRAQRGKGNFRLNIAPRVLAVSADLETQALRLVAQRIQAAKLADVSVAQAMNLTVIVLDKLPAGTFFLMGAKQFAQIVKILRLQGGRGPQIYSIPVADRLSLEWGAINDFAAQCVGRIGIVKGTIG